MQNLNHPFRPLLMALFISIIVSACYPMPNDDDISVIPMSNNPDFNKESDNPTLSPVKY